MIETKYRYTYISRERLYSRVQYNSRIARRTYNTRHLMQTDYVNDILCRPILVACITKELKKKEKIIVMNQSYEIDKQEFNSYFEHEVLLYFEIRHVRNIFSQLPTIVPIIPNSQ